MPVYARSTDRRAFELRIASIILLLLVFAAIANSQSTQAIITGRVFHAKTGEAIPGTEISCANFTLHEDIAPVHSNRDGYYSFPLLSPGTYYVRARFVIAGKEALYQPRDTYNIEVPVAGRIELDFPLRPLADVYSQELYSGSFLLDTDAIVHTFSADVRIMHAAPLKVLRGKTGALEASVSQVIDPAQIRDLPLAGRDTYTMLITQPGITADTGTARSLGLSANGQRPSSSNFLLDGLENNNYLISGPLTTIAPEAVQEYRISTNNYSAEYGRTGGYLANAVTRAGTDQWHGVAYFYLKNDLLNANDFQRNLQSLSRSPLKELQQGFSVSGPLAGRTLFGSASFEHLRFRSFGDPVNLKLPPPSFTAAPGTIAERLLARYPAPKVADDYGNATMAPLSSLDRYLALPRIDYLPSRGGRFMFRVAAARISRPDLVWTPYKDFVTRLTEATIAPAATWVYSRPSGFTNEARAGWNYDDLRFDRPHAEVPTLFSFDKTVLPGSPALYGYHNRSRGVELIDNMTWLKGRHIPKLGAGVLLRRLDGYLTIGRNRIYYFNDLEDFARDLTYTVYVALPRAAEKDPSRSTLPPPDYSREYSQNQLYAFAQDSFRLSTRLTLDYGVRYENFGAPRNTGPVPNAKLTPGDGDTFPRRLQTSHIDYPAKRNLRLYEADNNDWAVRAGFSWSLRNDARTLIRGSYGVFYDRPFDNQWENLRNNDIILASSNYTARVTNYLLDPSSPRSPLPNNPNIDRNFSRITLYQPGIQTAYVQSYFLGVQHQLGDNLTIEVNGLGSLSRKLITTDVLNRSYGLTPPSPPEFYRADLPPIYYRANQGASDFNALTALARWRTTRSQFQIAWTWSHSIDNQSEPLAGDFYNLDFVGVVPGQRSQVTAFTRQFDSRVDRGNSDFDQRHNMVFFSIWDLPSIRWFRNWKVAQLAAFRSGLPFTVFGPGASPIFSNRANTVANASAHVDQPWTGGKKILNDSAFAAAGPNLIGDSARNAFSAPGFYNIDLSLSRSFRVPRLGEKTRLTFRADAFNLLNHANLGTPNSIWGTHDFGVALYGRQGVTTGFPAAIPFHETARQIQLLLRLEF